MVVFIPPSPIARPRSLRLSFVRKDESELNSRRFVDVAEVQQESLAAVDSTSVEDFRQCFQQ
jgi:hypothetical protein